MHVCVSTQQFSKYTPCPERTPYSLLHTLGVFLFVNLSPFGDRDALFCGYICVYLSCISPQGLVGALLDSMVATVGNAAQALFPERDQESAPLALASAVAGNGTFLEMDTWKAELWCLDWEPEASRDQEVCAMKRWVFESLDMKCVCIVLLLCVCVFVCVWVLVCVCVCMRERGRERVCVCVRACVA